MIKFKELPREHAGLVQTKVTHIEQTSRAFAAAPHLTHLTSPHARF
jgi:hypothetical protein